MHQSNSPALGLHAWSRSKYDLSYYAASDKPKVICLGNICIFQNAVRPDIRLPIPVSLVADGQIAPAGFLEDFLNDDSNSIAWIEERLGFVPRVVGQPEVGYGPANAAICLKKLGFNAKIITKAGQDSLGSASIKLLQEQRVDTSLVLASERLAAKTPQVLAIRNLGLVKQVEKRVLVRSPGQGVEINLLEILKDDSYVQALKEAKGIFIANLDVPFADLNEFLATVRKMSPYIVIACNLKKKQQQWSAEQLASLFSKVTILTLHKDTGAMMLGYPERKRENVSLEELAQKIHTVRLSRSILPTEAPFVSVKGPGPDIVILTDHANGAIAYHSLTGHRYRVMAKQFFQKAVTSPDGAGDAFESTFFGSYICDRNDISSALSRAAINAAHVTLGNSTQDGLLTQDHLGPISPMNVAVDHCLNPPLSLKLPGPRGSRRR